MVKQLLSRNQRPEGFKVKHFLQICLSIAICFWIFNQLKHSYGTKRASLEDFRAGKLSENAQTIVEDVAILGRKHLHPRVNEENLLGFKEEEIKGEDTEGEGQEKEGEDQEEETEEVEDLIDVDDRIAGNEEKDNEEIGNNQLDQYAEIKMN